MRVVLFCGGLGLRMRAIVDDDHVLQRRAADAPKPMTMLGGQPLLWHLMRWYAHWGHREFVLCLGHRGDVIRDWCLQQDHETLTARDAGPVPTTRIRLRGGEVDGWDVTLAETGADSIVGQRLCAVRPLVDDEPMFLANYADGLSDVILPDMVAHARSTDAVATFLSVPLRSSLHAVRTGPGGVVESVSSLEGQAIRINGGFFVLRREVFDVLGPGEELVVEPFRRLIEQRRLAAVDHDGFWVALDTAKDRHLAEQQWQAGERPWAIWEPAGVGA